MTIQNNIHSQGVTSSDYGYGWVEAAVKLSETELDPLNKYEEEKGWIEWLATPIKAIWNYARAFFGWIISWFPWWKKTITHKLSEEMKILLPIAQAVDSLRKLTIEANKENANVGAIEKQYKKEFTALPDFVRKGLEAIGAKMLEGGVLRKKPSQKAVSYKSPEEALKRAKFILQKPDNKMFHLYPIFEVYLTKMNYRFA